MKDTLEEARTYLRKNLDSGAQCPCCRQFAKMYRRTITSSMAYTLILVKREFDNGVGSNPVTWVHVKNLLSNLQIPASMKDGGDFAKLEYWGLIEPHPEDAGMYRLTPDGDMFVHNRHSVKKYVKIYDGKAWGFDGDYVNIKDCLKNKFDYDALME